MVIPALDLIGGEVVRLYQGDYQQKTTYNVDPIRQFQSYRAQGAQWLHLVDLDGAKDSNHRQLGVIRQLLEQTQARIQIGGGIRSAQDVSDLLLAGAERVVVGSMAVRNPNEVKQWFHEFGGNRIVLALDVNIDEQGVKTVPQSGWQQPSDLTLEQLVEEFASEGLRHVLCTDISRDGTLTGSNVTLYQQVCQQYPEIAWQSSGGIGSLDDIEQVASSGVQGVILGRALLEGKFDVSQAIAAWHAAQEA